MFCGNLHPLFLQSIKGIAYAHVHIIYAFFLWCEENKKKYRSFPSPILNYNSIRFENKAGVAAHSCFPMQEL